jgi:cystathionine gamma-synthase
VVSLPTIADVIGYEERRPETMDIVRTGYPRFVQHPFITEAARKLAEESHMGTRAQFPVASTAAALRIIEILGVDDAGITEAEGWVLLHLTPNDPELARHAGKIIQHAGLGISSRQAEDWLVAHGYRAAIASETLYSGDASAAVRQALAPLLSPVVPDEILLCHSGMSAIFAAVTAARTVQRPLGRTLWLQLGWLYADTTEVFRKCLPADEEFFVLDNVFDKAAIEAFFEKNGSRLSAIITEAPTNPLMQTLDFAWLSALARRHGVLCILDPSTSSLVNVNLLPYADMLVTSLTKYAANESDVMMGAFAANPASPAHTTLLATARHTHTPAYHRDIARLAAQINAMSDVTARINANTTRLVAWLERQPAVRRVHWAGSADSAAHYAAIVRPSGGPGCMLSIELNIPMARFYDRIKTVKGPSFGTRFTLVSPFIYMAHYDLVTSAPARRELLKRGIDPELIRISTGTEPADELEAVFAEALA